MRPEIKNTRRERLARGGSEIVGSRGTTLLESYYACAWLAHNGGSPLSPGTERMARCPALR